MTIFRDEGLIGLDGHIKIWDPISGDIFVNMHNAIHFENMSIAIANTLASTGLHAIYEMHFGNGGTTVSGTGVVTYKSPNVNIGTDDLYNKTYYQVIDETDVINNLDPTNNKTEVTHVTNTTYSDIITTCTLDYNVPSGQDVIDNSTNMEDTYIFDELGLKSKGAGGLTTGLLLTHVIFHPVQKSANRLIQVVYTLRIRVG